MNPTILVTAPKLAKAGADLLAQAGARVIYLADPDSVEEVERIMATRARRRGHLAHGAALGPRDRRVPDAQGHLQAWRRRQQHRGRCGHGARHSGVRDAGRQCAVGGRDDAGPDVRGGAPHRLDGRRAARRPLVARAGRRRAARQDARAGRLRPDRPARRHRVPGARHGGRGLRPGAGRRPEPGAWRATAAVAGRACCRWSTCSACTCRSTSTPATCWARRSSRPCGAAPSSSTRRAAK